MEGTVFSQKLYMLAVCVHWRISRSEDTYSTHMCTYIEIIERLNGIYCNHDSLLHSNCSHASILLHRIFTLCGDLNDFSYNWRRTIKLNESFRNIPFSGTSNMNSPARIRLQFFFNIVYFISSEDLYS